MITLETLNMPQMMRETDPETVLRGKDYYSKRRARLLSVETDVAYAFVQGSQYKPYEVAIEACGDHVHARCSCPVSGDSYEIICKHIIATGLMLQDYLRARPRKTWDRILTQALDTAGRKAPSQQKLMLFFSLQTSRSYSTIQAYSLAASNFPNPLADPSTLLKIIKKEHLATQAKPIRTKTAPRHYVNLTEKSQAALSLLALSQEYGYSYYSGSSQVAKIYLNQLRGGWVFKGSENSPFQSIVEIAEEPVQPVLELTEDPEKSTLRAILPMDGKAISLHNSGIARLTAEPLWLMYEGKAFEVQGQGPAFEFFKGTAEVNIPVSDRDIFLQDYLIPLASQMPLQGDSLEWEQLEGEPQPRLYLTEADNSLLVKLRFAYTDQEVDYSKGTSESVVLGKTDPITMLRIARQPEKEEELWQQVTGFGLKRGAEPGAFGLRANVTPVDFLLHQVPRLTSAGFSIYGEEAITSAKINRNPPKLAWRVASGIDWFDLDALVSFGDQDIALKEIRRAVRKKERYVKLADGSIGEIPQEWLEKYRYLFALAEETDGGDNLRLSSAQVGLLDQLLEEGESIQADAEFEARRERLRAFRKITPKRLPKGLNAELRPYQKEGVDWLHFLHDYEFGGCLADDMGLGKTITTLTFLQALREKDSKLPANLLVLPRSLVSNWQRESAKFTPELRVLNHSQATRAKDLDDFDQYDIILTTYGILLRDIEMLRKHRFHYVVLDEAQAIKNPMSQSGKAARLLQGDHRLTLTGTPVENSTLEMWSQFAFLNPGLLGSLETFRNEFAAPIEKGQDQQAAELLRKMVRPFILRRTKDQVARDLPPRTERLVYTDMEPAQRKLYDTKRDEYRAQILGLIDEAGMNNAHMKVLEGLLRLRQISNHPRLIDPASKAGSAKFDNLLETLDTLQSEGHKALIFSQFVQMLTLVREEMDVRKIPYVYLDGKTKDRQERVDQFQKDESIPFFLISLRAGGVGLNLTAADYVIHIDPWWNPAVEMQATDRTHRIGQDKPVFVYKLIARDSVEEKILDLQARKRSLVNNLIGTEAGLFKSLTRSDIEGLFR